MGSEGLRYALSAMIASPLLAAAFLLAAIQKTPATSRAEARTA
jgi:hypothetical protein